MFSLGAFAIIFDPQGRVLLCHRRDLDIWNLPGGGVESGELPDEAVVREAREETGLEVVVERLVDIYGKVDDDVVFSFVCRVTGGELCFTEESDDCRYFEITEMPANTSPKHLERINDALLPVGQPVFRRQTAPSMREYVQHMQMVPLNDQRRLYSDLAWAWPLISQGEDYVQEAEAFARQIRQRARIPVSTLLHLGCGGGHLDLTLKKYFNVSGVDVSQPMLDLAGQLNPEVTYFPGDMRTVHLEKTFDAVVIADSIDYMLTEADLLSAFRTAYAHLKPGGIFCTYAGVTCQSFIQNDTRVSTHSDGSVVITYIENRYDPNPQDSTYEITFVYLIRRSGSEDQLEIETDRHLGGLFDLETWSRCLSDTGFEVHRTELGEGGAPLFVCRK
jgi:ADP-ribose pyrophosphatase YjhB (NUDIX family)/SAM-dependent methyltransferase